MIEVAQAFDSSAPFPSLRETPSITDRSDPNRCAKVAATNRGAVVLRVMPHARHAAEVAARQQVPGVDDPSRHHPPKPTAPPPPQDRSRIRFRPAR